MSSEYQTTIQEQKKGKNLEKYSFSKGFLTSKDLFIILCGIIISRGNFTAYLMPFGYALYGYIMYYDSKKWWLGFSILLGILTTGKYEVAIKNLAIYLLMTIVLVKFKNKIVRKWEFGLLISASVIITGIVINLYQSSYLFDMALVVVEGLLSFLLFYIYLTAVDLLVNRNRKFYSSQEVMCLGIFVSIMILGLSNLTIYKYSVSSIIAVFLILLFSFEIGIGVSAPLGMIFGLMMNVSSNNSPLLIVVYGMCGIISGMFKEGGKILVVMGFIVSNAMMAFYLNGSTEVFIHIEEIIIASLIFLVIPKYLWENLSFFSYDKVNESYQSFCKERIHEGLRSKLNKYSVLFKQMGTSFYNSEEVENKEIYNNALDKIANKVCKGCYTLSRCWETDPRNTYDMLLNTLKALEMGTQDTTVFDELNNKCLHDKEIIELLTFQVQLLEVQKEMQKRIVDNNLLISKQLTYTGQLINDLKNSLDDNWTIKSEEEKDILVELDKNDIGIDRLFVLQDVSSRYKVTITSSKSLNYNTYKDSIPKLISNVVNRRMVLDDRYYIYDDKPGCIYKYSESILFRLNTGILSFSSKEGEKSGDIFSDKVLENGNRILALCDGMGVGYNAYQESDTTINLLEKFMEAEIDKTVMVRNINSILMLRNEKEVFSTLDYVVFNQYTGEAEFNKIGGAITLIVSNDEIKLIRGQSLPVGILDEIKIETTTVKLDEGDLIIMMTDGIFECYDNPEKVEQWVIETVSKIVSNNPQKIAEELFLQFKTMCEKPKDDITILVGKVWRN